MLKFLSSCFDIRVKLFVWLWANHFWVAWYISFQHVEIKLLDFVEEFPFFFEWIVNFVCCPVLTMYIGSSWISSDLLSLLAVLAECLIPFIPGMIDVRCKSELVDLWWIIRNFQVLYSVFEITNVPRFIANLWIGRIRRNLKKKRVLYILPWFASREN